MSQRISDYYNTITTQGRPVKLIVDTPFYEAEQTIRNTDILGELNTSKVNIIFFTSSKMKYAEVNDYLDKELFNVVKYPIEIEEIQAQSPVTVVAHKLRVIARLYNERYPNGSRSKIWLLVEDTGMYKIKDVDNYPKEGFPHALVKWDMMVNGMSNLEGLVCEHSTFGIYNFNNGFHTVVEGRATGRIVLPDNYEEMKGDKPETNWDPYMIYTTADRFTSELTHNEKAIHSSRGEAISALTGILYGSCNGQVSRSIACGKFCQPGEVHKYNYIEDFYKLTYGHKRGLRVQEILSSRLSDEFHRESGGGKITSKREGKGIAFYKADQ